MIFRFCNQAMVVPVLASLLAFGTLTGCESTRGLAPGEVVPDFILRTPSSEVRKLSNYKGRPVLLNLWATWCPPCIAEMPVLNRIAEDYRDRGLVVVSIAGDEDTTAVSRFIAKNPLKFEVLLDPDGSVGTQYEITGYPETFLIDREGRLRDKIIGPVPSEGGQPGADFVQRLEALIGGT